MTNNTSTFPGCIYNVGQTTSHVPNFTGIRFKYGWCHLKRNSYVDFQRSKITTVLVLPKLATRKINLSIKSLRRKLTLKRNFTFVVSKTQLF